jgi:hypothetical protein
MILFIPMKFQNEKDAKKASGNCVQTAVSNVLRYLPAFW